MSPTVSALSPRTQATDEKVIDVESAAFAHDFNRTSFMFSHNLASHPLFDLTRLSELARAQLARAGTPSVRWQISNAPVDARWNAPLFEQKEKVTEAIADLEKSGSWVLLYGVQRDPEYRSLFEKIVADIECTTGLRREDVTWQDAYIFMASPGSVTPFHIDHESTFLFQIKGKRAANIWDANDRLVLRETEIEDYYIGDTGSATYKPEHQSKARVYALEPGKGVHHPVRAPHWFKNGSECSVALGIHFCLRDSDKEAPIYQINHYLRKVGLRPTPPGASRWRDRTKIGLVGLFAKRNPKTKYEHLRSGISRLALPVEAMKRLSARLSSRPASR